MSREPTVAARVPVDVKDALERIAGERDVPASTVIRQALREFTDRQAGTGAEAEEGARTLLEAVPAPVHVGEERPPRSLDVRHGEHRYEVLGAYVRAVDGLTAEEAATTLGLPTAARRVTELAQAGFIAPRFHGTAPARRKTRSGRPAAVFGVTPAGRATFIAAQAAHRNAQEAPAAHTNPRRTR